MKREDAWAESIPSGQYLQKLRRRMLNEQFLFEGYRRQDSRMRDGEISSNGEALKQRSLVYWGCGFILKLYCVIKHS